MIIVIIIVIIFPFYCEVKISSVFIYHSFLACGRWDTDSGAFSSSFPQ